MTTYRAIWNGVVLAESDATLSVEGNQYFPPESIATEYFRPSTFQTVCPWKGTAAYYSVEVDGATNPDAAWYYPSPKSPAGELRNYVAFWNGVDVQIVAE